MLNLHVGQLSSCENFALHVIRAYTYKKTFRTNGKYRKGPDVEVYVSNIEKSGCSSHVFTMTGTSGTNQLNEDI